MSSTEHMGFDEAVRMVLRSYNTIAKMVEAHKSIGEDQRTNKLLLECAILSIVWRRLGKPKEVGEEMAQKWREVCELNAVPEVA